MQEALNEQRRSCCGNYAKRAGASQHQEADGYPGCQTGRSLSRPLMGQLYRNDPAPPGTLYPCPNQRACLCPLSISLFGAVGRFEVCEREEWRAVQKGKKDRISLHPNTAEWIKSCAKRLLTRLRVKKVRQKQLHDAQNGQRCPYST